MKRSSFSKKRIIHICIVIITLIILFLTVGLIMLKYNVEGEKNLPFIIKKISIVSTAESDISQDEEEKWHTGILGKNDIFFIIEKNDNYKKQDTIKSIKFENFKIETTNEKMEISVYRPKSNDFDYSYVEEYKIGDSIVYEGAQKTNNSVLQINNQGGIIGLSICMEGLGEYEFTTNEKVPSDGRLLAKAGLKKEDIKFKISFDIIIETGKKNKFKGNITIELPTGNILEEGVCTEEITDLKNVVFKRIK